MLLTRLREDIARPEDSRSRRRSGVEERYELVDGDSFRIGVVSWRRRGLN